MNAPDHNADWLGKSNAGSKKNGVAQQRRKRTDVRHRVKPIRRTLRTTPAKPRLNQRARGREREVRQPDRRAEQHKNVPRRMRTVRRLVACVRKNRQQGQARPDQDDVYHRLMPARQPPLEQMGIQVAEKQHGLKKQYARRPNRRTPAEPGQNRLAHQRLHLEQQKCAEQNGRAECNDRPSRQLRRRLSFLSFPSDPCQNVSQVFCALLSALPGPDSHQIDECNEIIDGKHDHRRQQIADAQPKPAEIETRSPQPVSRRWA